jgi:hypothetical protein|uniref:HAT C-terminal dimerisation domain-containing protein n=1 Tax=Sipha flava TaxID=143950 RepID=A0A2S2QXH6_9HEMI
MAMISITIPVSTAGCERTFSCQRRLKTYMRNKMTDEHLSNLAMMSIKKKLAKSLDLDEVIGKFAVNHNNRKIIFVRTRSSSRRHRPRRLIITRSIGGTA